MHLHGAGTGAAMPWGRGLVEASHSAFLQRLPPLEVDRIAGLVDEVTPRLDAWARQYPLVRRERIGPLVLSVAAASPFSSADAIETTARVSLWVFTLDDVMDEELLGPAGSADFVARSLAVLRGDTSAQRPGSLAQALLDVRNDLRRYDLFAQFGAIWADALRGTIREMERENVWRDAYRLGGAGALPAFEDYVACGRYSIGGPPHIWAEVLTVGDPSACDAIDHLMRMEELASVCIRFANDLRSADREALEGNVNSVVIASRDLAASGAGPDGLDTRARSMVAARISAGLDALDAMQRASVTVTGRPESAIADIARFVCEFYRGFDYHTFSTPIGGRV
jgi:hypothetical protein